jgi:hypothetical protein
VLLLHIYAPLLVQSFPVSRELSSSELDIQSATRSRGSTGSFAYSKLLVLVYHSTSVAMATGMAEPCDEPVEVIEGVEHKRPNRCY